MSTISRLFALLGAALCVASNVEATPQSYGLNAPTPVGPYLNGALPDEVPGSAGTYTMVPAFPALTFNDPLTFTPHPNAGINYVGTRSGEIFSFVDTPNPASKSMFLDLTDRTAFVWDGGMLGLAFHPNFGIAGAQGEDELFVYYCYTPDGNYPTFSTNGFFNCYLRLSRFRVPSGSSVADPNSEEVMMHMRLFNGSHRGGHIAFGPDGFLYVPIGDQFQYVVSQDMENNLEGGVMRLDVDMDPTRSHAPIRTLPLNFSEEISGAGYWIPNDNPFLDATGTRFEEYYSLGHRAPHRMTFDSATGDLWIGEVGEGTREEINIVEPGNNYGWPFREGLTNGPNGPPSSFDGVLTDPVVDFMRTEANAIIGGHVYRGSDHPDLYGKYICVDYGQDRIFALTKNPISGNYSKEVIGTFTPGNPITFGEDRNGELYIGRQANNTTLYRFAATNPNPEPPALLSQVGAFSNLATLSPISPFVPYSLNAPFWSDDALKSRWIAIPNNGTHDAPNEQVQFDLRSGNWDFPAGTVVMKHFEYAMDDTDPSVRRRLETRFLVFTDNSFYNVSYHWLPDGSDAVLATDRVEEDLVINTASGSRTQTWTFPGRQDCRLCHGVETGGSLGLRTHQLNGEQTYPTTGVTDNQLRTWNHLGILAGGIDEASIPSLPASVSPADLSQSDELRARSYLDANCASCHRHDSITRAVFDARFETPLYAMDLLDGLVSEELGIAGAKVVVPRDVSRSIAHLRAASLGPIAMPPIAKNLVDDTGVEVIRNWILDLDPTQPVKLGNDVGLRDTLDGWDSNIVVNETDTYTNLGILAENIRVESFRFYANALTSPVTPFIVRVNGDNDFTVLAVGQTRQPGEYRAGDNAFPFVDGAEGFTRIQVQAGQTLAVGFLDANADGSGGAAGAVIPFCVCNGADTIWYGGGPNGGNSGSVTVGSAPDPGSNEILTFTREYAFAIDLAVERFNNAPVWGTLADQSYPAADTVSLVLNATDADGDNLVYRATGLPLGLTMDRESGEISGTIGPVGAGAFAVTVTASDGIDVAEAQFQMTVAPGAFTTIMVSLDSARTLPGGVTVTPADIAAFDVNTQAWSLLFDGSAFGFTAGITAFHLEDNGDLLLAFDETLILLGMFGGPSGPVLAPGDIVRFSPSTNVFSFFMDTSDIFEGGRRSGARPGIDAVTRLGDGRLAVSPDGRAILLQATVSDEDLVALTGTFGANTRVRGSIVFDGSEVNLSGASEDLDAVAVDPAGGLLLSFLGSAKTGPLGGAFSAGDVVGFDGSLGGTTVGSFRTLLDATTAGFAGANVRALAVE